MAQGKRYTDALKRYDREAHHAPAEALALCKSLATAKFDETIDFIARLGVDPRKADQIVRGTVALPAGTGKDVRIAVFAQGEAATAARDAGADHVGGDDLAEQVDGGMLDFDVAIATPDMMPTVGKLGRVLGPRGLMPNPKVGTVTLDVVKAVTELKAGRVEFRVEKAGIIHSPIGKASFSPEKLSENLNALMDTLLKLKPSTAKGTYIKSITISTTHGPGIKVEPGAMGSQA
jgi:large subunit ribosomal protein L1